MNNDLIEQLKDRFYAIELRIGIWEDLRRPIWDILRTDYQAAIAALSSVLPEDVRETIMYLSDEAQEMADANMHRNAKALHETADLIERLALNNEQLKTSLREFDNMRGMLLEKDSLCQTIEDQQQRIEELERERAVKFATIQSQDTELRTAQQRIAELGEDMARETGLANELTAELVAHKTQIAEYEKALRKILKAVVGYRENEIDRLQMLHKVEDTARAAIKISKGLGKLERIRRMK